MSRLNQYAAEHLQSEERLLTQHGYPRFQAHKAEHDLYIARIRNYQEQLARGCQATSGELMQFLRNWWTTHILTSDQAYSAFLRQKGVA